MPHMQGQKKKNEKTNKQTNNYNITFSFLFFLVFIQIEIQWIKYKSNLRSAITCELKLCIHIDIWGILCIGSVLIFSSVWIFRWKCEFGLCRQIKSRKPLNLKISSKLRTWLTRTKRRPKTKIFRKIDFLSRHAYECTWKYGKSKRFKLSAMISNVIMDWRYYHHEEIDDFKTENNFDTNFDCWSGQASKVDSRTEKKNTTWINRGKQKTHGNLAISVIVTGKNWLNGMDKVRNKHLYRERARALTLIDDISTNTKPKKMANKTTK